AAKFGLPLPGLVRRRKDGNPGHGAAPAPTYQPRFRATTPRWRTSTVDQGAAHEKLGCSGRGGRRMEYRPIEPGVGKRLAILRESRCALRSAGQTEMMPARMAYWISSAVLPTPRASLRRALWNSAVRREMCRRAAISLAERPSVTS